MSDIRKQKFVCVDCETTGLDPKQDRVIEVAVMCFDADEILAEYESLVDPLCEVPETSIAIHHITQEMVNGQPTIERVLPEVLKIIGKHIIIGHGVGFDIEILSSEAERLGVPCDIRYNRSLDTLRMARLYGESPINSLEHLRKHFNIPQEGAHRAMSDVVVNRSVFYALAKRFKRTEDLFDALSRPILMSTMPLGKHKGRSMKDIPLQYLQWMVNKDFDQDLLFSLKTELKRRNKGDAFCQSFNPFSSLS